MKISPPEASIIHDDETRYIAMSKPSAFIYLDLPQNTSIFFNGVIGHAVSAFASRGVNTDLLERCRCIDGRGEILLEVRTNMYRGDLQHVSPDTIVPRQSAGLSMYLEPTETINSDDQEVRTVASDLINQIPTRERGNPFTFGERATRWIQQNIDYTPIPKDVTARVARTVSQLPQHTRLSPSQILINTFTHELKPDQLMRVANEVSISPSLTVNASDMEIARHIMDQACELEKDFGYYWGGNTSAKRTLSERSGKCSSMANLFTALNRAAGFPCRVIGGILDNGVVRGKHAWSSTHMLPLGWVESDPTNFDFNQFEPSIFGYELFSHDEKNLTAAAWNGTTFGDSSVNTQVLRLLDRQQSILHRVFNPTGFKNAKQLAAKMRSAMP